MFTHLFKFFKHGKSNTAGATSYSGFIDRFSLAEKTLLTVLTAGLILATAGLWWQISDSFLVTVPYRGGRLNEAVIGSAGPINPLLSTTQTDRDLVKLIFAGLMKTDSQNRLVPELAETYQVSEDRTEYVFTLKEKARFHDGRPVRAEDVVFTVNLAQDPSLRSFQQAKWNNVTAEALDPLTVRFTLAEPRDNFLSNATLGILPRHIWESVAVNQIHINQYNVRPIGAGPFRIKDIERQAERIISYRLEAFADYPPGRPHLEAVNFYFYSNEEDVWQDLRDGRLDSFSNPTPALADQLARLDGWQIQTAVLPRVFVIYFNQDEEELLTDRALRRALKTAVDKEALVQSVLGGYGQPVEALLPPSWEAESFGLTPADDESPAPTDPTESSRPEQARAELEAEGWQTAEDTGWLEKDGQELNLSLLTLDQPEMKQTTQEVISAWRAAGIKAEMELIESGEELYQQYIRPRRFSTLLYGYSLNQDLDLYPFWHSSARSDPGLNIGLYADIQADDLLERLQTASEPADRQALYLELKEEIKEDSPALFLYSPEFIYLTPAQLKQQKLPTIFKPEDRFFDIHRWYLKTDRVWRFLL